MAVPEITDERYGLSRRAALQQAGAAGLILAGVTVGPHRAALAEDDEIALLRRLLGKTPIESERVHLDMPAVFANGYTVPMAVAIDTPMTELDHAKSVRVFAPRNPIIEVVGFSFMPGRSLARISTRIRLAEPQFVLAAAEMADGTVLMARRWVEVEINGCA